MTQGASALNPIVADTDGDGLSDGAEVNTHGSNPLVTDTDGDGMPDGWEASHGLSATLANAYDDADGDRYPNIFEYAYSTDPSDDQSVPTSTYVVNPAGGGTHTTISDAVNAANVANGAYQIIGIAPGVYKGHANLRGVGTTSTKPNLLIIGLQGASKTIIDGEKANYGWFLRQSAVISSLTFQNTLGAVVIDAPSKEVRFVDVLMRDNATRPGESATSAVHVAWLGKLNVIGSTFLNNTATTTVQQIYVGNGVAALTNTVVGSQASGTMLGVAGGVGLTTNYCLVKGQTLTGTGNLAGTVDPKLTSEGRLRWDSPLRTTGGTVPQSRRDMDGEARPTSTPDIGVDQFVDSDSDGLADIWETAQAGNLTTLTSRTQDADSDGLTNDEEYVAVLNPVVADTDGDGLSDGAEVNTHGTNPLISDSDGDGMPDGWEVSHGLSAILANAYDDDDGDRYPNIFEYASSTDPSDDHSIPTPTYVVNPAGGGTHTTIGDAVNAANVANGAYQIIGISPGVYKGNTNLRGVSTIATKPHLLIIGLQGAGNTIIDGDRLNYGWILRQSAVVASLTFQNTLGAIYIDAPSKEVRFVDVLMRNNATRSGEFATSAVHVAWLGKLDIVGSTFLNNTATTSIQQIYVGNGAAVLTNTIVWSQSSGAMLGTAGGITLTTNYCLVKGQTLTGTGNLGGSVNPKLRSDARLRSDSPLRAAGGQTASSKFDIDGELRPASMPDIGVDQFNDTDSDGLSDAWEVATAGNTTTIAGAADADSDGLTNAEEYDYETNWLDADSDNDGFIDGLELTLGLNPTIADTDDQTNDLNQDGLMDNIGGQLGYQPDDSDDDGDLVSNANEVLMCTNPFRADSDGDGIPDDGDVFPHDPMMSSLSADPEDVTAPVITLIAPWYAVLQ